MINEAIKIIRELDELDCGDLQALLNVIANKMASTGYSELDLGMIDEATGYITGEQK